MMGKKMIHQIIIFCVLILLVNLEVHAVRVEPARVDLSITKGNTVEVILHLRGSKGNPIERLKIYLTDLSIKRNGNMDFSLQKDYESSAVKWIKLEKENLIVRELRTTDFKFKVTIPRSIVPGEYYAIVMIEGLEPSILKDPNKPLVVKLFSKIAVPVIFDVAGRVYQKKGRVIETKAIQMEDGRIKIHTTFHNQGDIHLEVLGSTLIKSKDGRKTYARIPLQGVGTTRKDSGIFIMPNNMRDFEGISESPVPLASGEYVADVSFDIGYKFKKAREKASFTVARAVSIDESQLINLEVYPGQLDIEAPPGSLRTMAIKVTNTSFDLLEVSANSKQDWAEIMPQSFELKPEQAKNLKLTLKIPGDLEIKKEAKIVFKPNKGKNTEAQITVYAPGKMPKKEKDT